jgi:hypothetical protein
MVIAERSLVTDGTSKIYQNCDFAESSSTLSLIARSISHFNPISAQAVCIDALLQETKELIDSYISMGGEIINMESSAFYAAYHS